MIDRRFAAPGETSDVVAVIPTLGRDLPRLRSCLDAVRAQDLDAELAVIVVVNAAEDPDVTAAVGPDVTSLRPGFNLGWAGGLRAARRLAPRARRMWLVQDDLVADPACLREEMRELDADPSLAAVSPLALTDEGLVRMATCGGVLRWQPEIDLVGWLPTADVPLDELGTLAELDYVPSRGMLVDLAAWDAVGGMHAGYYPVIWTDVDFCTALRASGRRFGLARNAHVRHEGHGSTPSPFGNLLLERHRRLFASRWGAVERERRRGPDTLEAELVDEIGRAAAGLAGFLAGEYSRLSEQVTELTSHVEAARAETASVRREVDELRRSTSWRVTAPLRAVRRLVRRG